MTHSWSLLTHIVEGYHFCPSASVEKGFVAQIG